MWAGAAREGLNGHMTNRRHPMASDVSVLVLLCRKGHYRECERKEDWSLKNCRRGSINSQTAKGLWRRSRKQISQRAFSSSFAGGKTLRRDCFSPRAESISGEFSHFLLCNVSGKSDGSDQDFGIQQGFRWCVSELNVGSWMMVRSACKYSGYILLLK